LGVKVINTVRHDGKIYEAGQIIQKISDDQAKRLTDMGVAFFVDQKEASETPSVQLTDEQKQIYADLDTAYGYDELKQVAANVGMTFKGNISKKDLILQIISENKVGEFLEEEEE
jgi:flagellar biosynthesis/type III secretory pathway M-ring protein FliF/YscJ